MSAGLRVDLALISVHLTLVGLLVAFVGLLVALVGLPVSLVGSIVSLIVTGIAVVLALVQPLLSVIQRRCTRSGTSVAQLRVDLSLFVGPPHTANILNRARAARALNTGIVIEQAKGATAQAPDVSVDVARSPPCSG